MLIKQMFLTDMYRKFYPNTKEYTFYSTPHATFSQTDHILEHKGSLNRHKNIEVAPYILSEHHRLKLDIIHNNRSSRKHTNAGKVNNSLLYEK